jgi:hypothetical protein
LAGVKVYTYTAKDREKSEDEVKRNESMKILENGSVTEATDVQQTTTVSEVMITTTAAIGKNKKRDSKTTSSTEVSTTTEDLLLLEDGPSDSTDTALLLDSMEEISSTLAPKATRKKLGQKVKINSGGDVQSSGTKTPEPDGELAGVPDDPWDTTEADDSLIETSTANKANRKFGQTTVATSPASIDFEALTEDPIDELSSQSIEGRVLTFSPEEELNETVVVTLEGPDIGPPTKLSVPRNKVAKKSAGIVSKRKFVVKESGLRKRSQPVFEVVDEATKVRTFKLRLGPVTSDHF